MALGMNKNFQFQEFPREGWTPGSVIRVDFGFWIADCGLRISKKEDRDYPVGAAFSRDKLSSNPGIGGHRSERG
jgi:hypothetical protein